MTQPQPQPPGVGGVSGGPSPPQNTNGGMEAVAAGSRLEDPAAAQGARDAALFARWQHEKGGDVKAAADAIAAAAMAAAGVLKPVTTRAAWDQADAERKAAATAAAAAPPEPAAAALRVRAALVGGLMRGVGGAARGGPPAPDPIAAARRVPLGAFIEWTAEEWLKALKDRGALEATLLAAPEAALRQMAIHTVAAAMVASTQTWSLEPFPNPVRQQNDVGGWGGGVGTRSVLYAAFEGAGILERVKERYQQAAADSETAHRDFAFAALTALPVLSELQWDGLGQLLQEREQAPPPQLAAWGMVSDSNDGRTQNMRGRADLMAAAEAICAAAGGSGA